MITADRKHWKGQLAFAHQLLIVDRVLGKRRKLSAERIVNGARLSVQSGVMVAGLVVDAGWGCGQLILRTLLLCSSLAEATVLTGRWRIPLCVSGGLSSGDSRSPKDCHANPIASDL